MQTNGLLLILKEYMALTYLLLEITELLGMGANTFSYAELRTATKDFNPASKLGEGGFGAVYKVS